MNRALKKVRRFHPSIASSTNHEETMKRPCVGLLLTAVSAMTFATATTVDFSNEQQGWNSGPAYDGNQGSYIDTSLGASPVLRTINPESFGMSWSNTVNPAFIGNFGAAPALTLGIDVLANSIVYLGHEVARNLVVELRDHDNPYRDMPYTSVWYNLGTIAAGLGWQHLSVTIDDTGASALPGGWGGFGNDDTETDGMPALPPGRTFADVLGSVDELVFTTYVPGYFYGWTAYDIAVDNISITRDADVPEPAGMALLAGGLAVLGLARRRRFTPAGACETAGGPRQTSR
jgi:hypothetical protein